MNNINIMTVYAIELDITEGGDIVLSQVNHEHGHENIITISPDQVEQLIAGLNKAVGEIQGPE